MEERRHAVSNRRLRSGRNAAAALGLAAAFAFAARAGTPPPPTEPPEAWLRVTVARPGAPLLEVAIWMQYGHSDSVDLRLSLPGLAHWARLEAHVAAEALVLQPNARTGAYRVEVPRGALLQWEYAATLATAESLPQSFGADHACAYLGGFVLAPQRFDQPQTPAVDRWFMDATLPPHWRAVGPWRQPKGQLRPRSTDDLGDNFAGWGRWKARTAVVAGACTLQVAAAGGLPDSLGAGRESLLAQQFGAGCALVLLVPSDAAPRAFTASHSALVRVVATPDAWAGFDAAWAVRRPVLRPRGVNPAPR